MSHSTIIPSLLSPNQIATGVGRWNLVHVALVQIEDGKAYYCIYYSEERKVSQYGQRRGLVQCHVTL